jgi:hypothetical protein
MSRFRVACTSSLFFFLSLVHPYRAEALSDNVEASVPAWMPFTTIGTSYVEEAVLSPMGPGSSNHFGDAIAVAVHPDTAGTQWAVIGAPSEVGGGAVYIFSLAAGASEWHQEVRLANPGSDGDYFGDAVAIDTADLGTGTIAVGAPYTESNGKAFVYTRQTDGSWKNTAAIGAPAGASGFGRSILLSGNALLMVGAPYSNTDRGQVNTFALSGTIWSPQRTLVPSDPEDYSHFGETLAFDGNDLLIGRPFENGSGSAYIFYYHPFIGTWTFRQKLTPADTSGRQFGVSVAIAGTTALVGYSAAADYHGAVSIFEYDTTKGLWTEQPELQSSDAAEQYFGQSIATDAAGTQLLVASSYGTNSAHLYTKSGSTWNLTADFKSTAKNSSAKLVALSDNIVFVSSSEAELDLPYRGIVESFTQAASPLVPMRATTDEDPYYFASSVSLSGMTAIVSAPNQVNVLGETGTANIYVRSPKDGWEWQAGLPQALDPNLVTGFGCTTQVAIDGDTAVIGEPSKAVGTHLEQGVASVYVRSGSTWNLQETLYDRSGQARDYFGCSVAIVGNTIVAGAPGMNSQAGGGYVATRSGTTWTDPTKLVASDGASGDRLGTAVAVAGHTIVLGSTRNNDFSGAAYIFTGSVSSWAQSQKLVPDVGSGAAKFGTSIALSRDERTLVIGAPHAQVGSATSGNGLIYTNDGRSWSLHQTLNSSASSSERFGNSVSIDGDTLLVGEPGAAQIDIFMRSGTSWVEKASLGSDTSGQFGSATCISRTSIIAGAPDDQSSGRAYIFNDANQIFADAFGG